MSDRQSFKVIIAEDEYRIRENLVTKISETHPRFEVVASAVNGEQALRLISENQPDLLITDIKMPVMDGLELIEELYFLNPDLSVVILSGYDDFSYAKKAIRFGVKEYILKPVSKKELSEVLGRLEVMLESNLNLLTKPAFGYDSEAAAKELCGKIAEFLKARFTDEISIAHLSEIFNLNPTYMSRVFKQQTGRTPTRFLIDLRINKAKKLLSEDPVLEIKEVAIKLGFQDQNYFSRLFKKETGISPLEFRNRP